MTSFQQNVQVRKQLEAARFELDSAIQRIREEVEEASVARAPPSCLLTYIRAPTHAQNIGTHVKDKAKRTLYLGVRRVSKPVLPSRSLRSAPQAKADVFKKLSDAQQWLDGQRESAGAAALEAVRSRLAALTKDVNALLKKVR